MKSSMEPITAPLGTGSNIGMLYKIKFAVSMKLIKMKNRRSFVLFAFVFVKYIHSFDLIILYLNKKKNKKCSNGQMLHVRKVC